MDYTNYEREGDLTPTVDPEDMKWLSLARDAYRTSSSFMDSSLRRQFERNLDAFNNRHPSGSKYYSDAYKYRSKLYRPKTRSVIRRGEAAAAVAYFSTSDGVHVQPVNENNKLHRVAAAVHHELLNYRLEQTIPWFMTCIGAYQEAQNLGAVVSKQEWVYEERDGQVITDEPRITLIPIENLRIDPASDWIDPVNSSPYVIELMPMYVCDVQERMQTTDPKTGQPQWREYSENVIRSASKQDNDSVRRAREGNRVDSKDPDTTNSQFDIVWVHCNIVKQHGTDMIFYTLGQEYMLSDPVPLNDVHLHGIRPYRIGHVLIEAHKLIPAGKPELTSGLQQEANEVVNQRLDNVKYVLNRRYFARKGAVVDTRSLARNIPGSVTLMGDINNDVRSEAPPDVTQSSYAEQDRINVDFDELAGSFSAGSVQTNRQLNETVGGMSMLREGADAMAEYELRVFAETWVEPVLRQLVMLEQAYETDKVVLTMAGRKARLFEEFGVQYLEEDHMKGDLLARVNVGFGSTNPEKRVQKLAMGLGTLSQFFPEAIRQADVSEVASEIFGALGYKDGARFLPHLDGQEDPRIQQMQQEIMRLSQALESKMMEIQATNESRERIAQMNLQGKVIDIEGKRQQGIDKSKTDLGKTAMELRSQRQNFVDEAALKQAQGQQANYGLEGS